MKILSIALAAIIAYNSQRHNMYVVALKPKRCGGSLTSPCLADTNPKYDDDFPSSIFGQDERWKKFEGLWMTIDWSFDSTFGPAQPSPYIGGRGVPYTRDVVKVFFNHTIKGSRLIVNRYYVYDPAPASFCEETPPNQNVKGNGICGVNGYTTYAGHFGSSTHENDGKLDMIRVSEGYSPLPYGMPYDLNPPGIFAWVDENTLQGTNTEEGIFSQNNVYVFTNNTSAAINSNSFLLKTNQFHTATMGNTIRADNEQQWIDALNEAYEESNVLEDERLDPRIVNDEVSYPLEEDWCGGLTNDPSCTVSPYQEPDAKVNGGAIAGFTILGVVLFVITGYMLHRYRMKKQMKKQKRRYRIRFIRNIARNITVTPTPGALSQDILLKEFNHIDKDKGGTITKEELKAWMSDGKLGEISDADFNALWAAMDIDNTGYVNFIEFCTFLSGCGEAFDEVYEEQKNMTNEERMNLASRRLSLMSVKEFLPAGSSSALLLRDDELSEDDNDDRVVVVDDKNEEV